MILKRVISLSVLAATCAVTFGGLSAQHLSRDTGPAETPPSSFRASQYVDSKGCVYIRAGIDGNTTWVPRVGRDRKVVCGLTPSLGSNAAKVAKAAPAPKKAAPVQIGANNPVVETPKTKAAPSAASAAVAATPQIKVAPAAKPKRTTLASVLAPKPVRTVASTPASQAPMVQRVNIPQPSGLKALPGNIRRGAAAPKAAAPTVVVPATGRRVVSTAPRRVTGAQTCEGASALSKQYIGGRGAPVRCGPQGTVAVTTAPRRTVAVASTSRKGVYRSTSGEILDPASISLTAVIVPRHVYEAQQAAKIAQPIPEGYRQAWTDDRLNPRRAHQTMAGMAQTDLRWTKTVPRRLIFVGTGRDVTRMYPDLKYPYTSMAEQAVGMQRQATVSTKNRVVKRKAVAAAPSRVSTRSAPQRKQVQATAGKRYVQIGTFGVSSNARRAAGNLQRMGLPVRIGNLKRGGKTLQIVLAGPFASASQTNGALSAVRRAGYRDAFARN